MTASPPYRSRLTALIPIPLLPRQGEEGSRMGRETHAIDDGVPQAGILGGESDLDLGPPCRADLGAMPNSSTAQTYEHTPPEAITARVRRARPQGLPAAPMPPPCPNQVTEPRISNALRFWAWHLDAMPPVPGERNMR